jgi:CSLREA domain-containing protein
MPQRAGFVVAGVLAFLAVLGLTVSPLPAATITVNSTADAVDSDDRQCTLREAVIAANTDSASGSVGGECAKGDPGGDVIDFVNLTGSPDVYKLAIPPSASNDTHTGDLNITDNVSIVGNGSIETIIDGDHLDRVFQIGPGISVLIRRVAIRHGAASRGSGIANDGGTLTVHLSHVHANSFGCGTPNCTVDGAGLWNSGTLLIDDSTIEDNLALCKASTCRATGGGITNAAGGNLSVSGFTSVFSNKARCVGRSCEAAGGGIWSQGSLLDQVGFVQANRVECDVDGLESCSARGGGVFISGSGGFIEGSVIQDNLVQCVRASCRAEGGGLFNESEGTPLTLQGSHVIGNLARGVLSARGGGIFNEGGPLNIRGSSTVSHNLAGCVRRIDCVAEGGGLYNSGGFVFIVETTFSGNALASRRFAWGGGIRGIGGNLAVERSTLRGNFILGNRSVLGGGIALGASHLTLLNSTLSGNFVGCWGQQCVVAQGGGLYFCCEGGQGPPAGSVAFTTFAGNFAACGSCAPTGGGILTDITLQIRESIVANSSPLDCVSLGGPFEVGGTANLDTDGSCPGFSLPAANANLGPLASNGGPTETHALLAGSPAIDAASACLVGLSPISIDQRNAPRPGGSACDLGAYELVRGFGGAAPTPPRPPGVGSDATDRAKCRVVRVLQNGLRALERRGDLTPEGVESVREAAERLRAASDCGGKGPR